MADDIDDVDRSLKGDRITTIDTSTPLSYAPSPLMGGTTGNAFLDSRSPPVSFDQLLRIAQADQDGPLTDEDVARKYPDLPGPGAGFPVLPPMDGKTMSDAAVDEVTAQRDQLQKQDFSDGYRQAFPQQGVPPIPQPAQTSDSIVRNAIGAFANPLMLIAATAGALTKRPALNALAAATGVMEGLNQRDWQKAYLQQHKFRNSVKETAVEADRQIAAVDAILNSGADTATKLGNIDALGDPTLSRFARQADLGSIQQFNEGFKKATEGLHRATRGYSKAQEKLAEEKEATAAGKPPGMSAKDWSQILRERKEAEEGLGRRGTGAPAGADWSQPLSPGKEERARSYAQGNWRAASGGSKADQEAIKNRGSWLADHPEEMETGRPGLTERTKEFAAGMTASQTAGRIEGRIVSALSRAQKAAPIVINLSERVNRSEFPDLNTLILSTKQRIGDVSVTEFRTALQTLVLNYAQAIGGGVQGAVTVDAAKHARELLDIAFSKGQVRGTVRQMLFDIDRELEGAHEAAKTVSGTSQALAKDREQEAYEWAIQNLDNPQAQQVLKKLGL